jgi:hypothetical protein
MHKLLLHSTFLLLTFSIRDRGLISRASPSAEISDFLRWLEQRHRGVADSSCRLVRNLIEILARPTDAGNLDYSIF